MMVYGIDDNNDWLFGLNEGGFRRGKDAVAQNCKTRLQCFKNDWYLDITDGIDWFAILDYNKKDALAKAVFSRVSATLGVKKVHNFDDEKLTLEVESIFSRQKDTVSLKIT